MTEPSRCVPETMKITHRGGLVTVRSFLIVA